MAHRGRKNADEVFLATIACGATVESAASKAGISRRTAHRRLLDPQAQKQLAELRAETVRRCCALLTAASLEAVKTLLDLQHPQTLPGVRLGAAKAIIELGTRLREQTEMAERIAALEARL
jgi:hypothetical protein